MHRNRYAFPALAAVLICVGCGNDSVPQVSHAGQFQRMDQFCATPGLDKPLRQTFILVDQKQLKGINSPQEFAEKNAKVRDAVLAFANPVKAVEYGKSAARERITLMIAPSDGSAPRKLFTGCLPALSPTDRQKIAQSETAVSNFFTGGFEQDVKKASDSFNSRVVGALINASNESSSEDPATSKILQSLAAAGPVFTEVETVPRIVIISDGLVENTPASLLEARQAGLAFGAGQKAQLGNAQILVVGTGSQSESARGYLSAVFLSMGADLSSWAQSVDGLTTTPAPVSVSRYAGEVYVTDTTYRELVNVRIAVDQNNRLVNSWVILLYGGASGVPMTGGGVCSADGTCEFRSDSGPFAQVWIPNSGSEPAFDDTKPFGGMRSWSFAVKGGKLTGRVYDAAINRVLKEGQADFKVDASLVQNSNF